MIEQKNLPFSVTKKKLVEMYCNQMSEKTIINGINEIILENRKSKSSYRLKKPKQIKTAKLVWHVEFMEFIATYGEPKGYQTFEDKMKTSR